MPIKPLLLKHMGSSYVVCATDRRRCDCWYQYLLTYLKRQSADRLSRTKTSFSLSRCISMNCGQLSASVSWRGWFCHNTNTWCIYTVCVDSDHPPSLHKTITCPVV